MAKHSRVRGQKGVMTKGHEGKRVKSIRVKGHEGKMAQG